MFRCWLTGYTGKTRMSAWWYTGKTRMFRHDIREKPVLYKEILKAISKRELLEDLCFCACRKDHFAGGSSPSLKGKCPGTPFGGFPDTPVPLIPTARRYSVPSGLVQTSFLTNVRHEWFYAVGKVPLRRARNSRVLRQWLKFTYPRTSCKFTKPQSNTN